MQLCLMMSRLWNSSAWTWIQGPSSCSGYYLYWHGYLSVPPSAGLGIGSWLLFWEALLWWMRSHPPHFTSTFTWLVLLMMLPHGGYCSWQTWSAYPHCSYSIALPFVTVPSCSELPHPFHWSSPTTPLPPSTTSSVDHPSPSAVSFICQLQWSV